MGLGQPLDLPVMIENDLPRAAREIGGVLQIV
jgi:hypothetical protein